jgi:nucleotide-binding universal stress UspA family protein
MLIPRGETLMQNIDAFQSILVGDDGSPEAKRAVVIAFSLAKRYSAKLTLLCVKTPPSAEQQAEGYGLEEHERTQSQLRAEVEQSAKSGVQQGVKIAITIINAAEPAKEIEQYAEKNDVDLLVVGHRDVSRVRYWLEGSTSENLLRHSSASILIVHKGK